MIYVVICEHGEYSYYNWWTVIAYNSREAAEDHAERAQLQSNLAAFIAESRYASGTREAYDSLPLADFEGDDGFCLVNPYDPEPESEDWSTRHRFHEAVANYSVGTSPTYRVLDVPMEMNR